MLDPPGDSDSVVWEEAQESIFSSDFPDGLMTREGGNLCSSPLPDLSQGFPTLPALTAQLSRRLSEGSLTNCLCPPTPKVLMLSNQTLPHLLRLQNKVQGLWARRGCSITQNSSDVLSCHSVPRAAR